MFNELLGKIRNVFNKCVIKTKNALIEKSWLKWVAVVVAAVLIGGIVLCSLTMCKGDENSAPSSISNSSSSVETSASIEDTESSVVDSESASEAESSESADSSSEEFVIPEIPEVPVADKKKGSTSDFVYEYNEDMGGLVLLSIGDYSAPTLDIPSTIFEYDDEGSISSVKMVVAIGEKAISGYDTLKVVIIPNTIREIEDGAFEGCVNLHRVEIGEMVSYIGWGAFKGCDNLKTVLFSSCEGWVVSVNDSVNKDDFKLEYEDVAHHENVAKLLRDVYHRLYWFREVY